MKNIGRREFLAGAAAGLTLAGLRNAAAKAPGEIIAAGARADRQVDGALRAALDSLGGISRFIKGGEKIALLPNPQGFRTGASTRPDLVAAMAKICLEAGAAEVRICSIHDKSRWSGTGIIEAAAGAGAGFWAPGAGSDWREVELPGAARQNRLRVIAPALESDLVINMPIAKHHGSTRFTGAMKNLMGFNFGNSGWHQGTSYLVESIVDLAAAVRPRLHIVDVTEVLAENGPFGPGRNVTPGMIVAGVDPVAVDAICAGLIGMEPRSISTITRGAERGLGAINLIQESRAPELTTWRAI